MATLKQRLTNLLLDGKYLTQEQLGKVVQMQNDTGRDMKDILVKEGFIEEKRLISLLSKELFIPYLNLERYKISPQILSLIPDKIARQYKVVAISLIGNMLTVAMADPLNVFAIDDLNVVTGYEITPVISSESDIMKAIEGTTQAVEVKEVSEVSAEESSMRLDVVKDESGINIEDAIADSKKAPIVKIVDVMVVEALKRRASDIHIEPAEKDLKIRYRIDGRLHDAFRLPKKNQNSILARIKIISGLDITEARLPQDGRFKARLKEQEVDFRVSALPTTFGQKFVLRALDRSKLAVGLDKLDMSPIPMKLFKEAILKPYGMILVTGPTGSGKSTTLYSIITQLNTIDRNIVTIEDPVEYQIEGITQIQAKADIGLNFASGLRALLRQSPDIILVGEIRDSETVDIAVKASLTGHLVLSTLHTNDACGAITRMIDMGVEPFLVASSIILTSAQRLCRRICTRCREEISISIETLKKIGIYDLIEKKENPVFYHGKGCKNCNNTGYYGRIAVHEVVMMDDEIRDMIVKGSSDNQIKEFIIKEKAFQTLRNDALDKCFQGIISLEEVIRVTTEG